MIPAHTARCLALGAITLLLAAPSPADSKTRQDELFALRNNQEKILYALGLSLAERLGDFSLDERELKVVQAGLREGLRGQAQVSLGIWAHRVEGLRKTRMERTAERERKASEQFLSSERLAPGAVKRPSGLIYRELEAGDGPRPTSEDTVKVHYHGTLIDGTVFDSSVERGKPSKFGLGGVIACWREGVAMMSVGTRARLVCPAPIAYGQKGLPGKIKPGATLVFEVELLDIVTPPAARD